MLCVAQSQQSRRTRLSSSGVQNLNSMAAKVPTHALVLRGYLFYKCPNYSRAMHATFPGNPSAHGPWRLQGILTCARPERAIHTTCMNPPVI